ncbi:MAG: deoxyuridine 5'-triphosphate nucleotidohydrolase [Firmicutes bacterium]|nr:deoxyuridine 5'-triphosphate nucleotidohydrolase [Bacillota bacterium]
MKKVAKFEKVSFSVFLQHWKDILGEASENSVREIYDSIELPKRATLGSAGYDFFCPETITLLPGKSATIPTGVRVRIDPGWVLTCYPRSGLGFKYRLGLDNTVGIIDSDYYSSRNEGHIIAKITNNSHEGKTLTIGAGEGFMQGIFIEYGITEDDSCTAVRDGGFGSTTKNKNI